MIGLSISSAAGATVAPDTDAPAPGAVTVGPTPALGVLGAVFVLAGSNLSQVTGATVGGVPALVTAALPGLVTVVAPLGLGIGPKAVVLLHPAGNIAAGTFTVIL